MPYMQTERLNIHYKQYGQGPIPVVLVHGNLVSGLSWQKTAELLADSQYTVYVPDNKGCGRTEETGEGHFIPEFADDLFSFIQALKLENFHLVGHSLGGAISLALVLRYPKLAKTLTMLDSVPAEGLHIPQEVLPLFAAMKADKHTFVEAMLGTVPTAKPDDPYIVRMLDEAFQSSVDTFIQNSKNCDAWNVESRLGELIVPTMVIWGTLDTWISREPTERMANLIPGCQLEILEGVGHSPNMECPERLVNLLQRFWSN